MHTAEWPIGPLCCAKPKHNQAKNTHPSRLGHCRTSSRWKSPQTASMVGKTSARVTRLHPRHLATSVWFHQSTPVLKLLSVCPSRVLTHSRPTLSTNWRENSLSSKEPNSCPYSNFPDPGFYPSRLRSPSTCLNPKTLPARVPSHAGTVNPEHTLCTHTIYYLKPVY